MHHDLAAVVLFLPGEVVMVLDPRDRLFAEEAGDAAVDHIVIRRRVIAHQVHRRPVLLSLLGVEGEPRELTKPLVAG